MTQTNVNPAFDDDDIPRSDVVAARKVDRWTSYALWIVLGLALLVLAFAYFAARQSGIVPGAGSGTVVDTSGSSGSSTGSTTGSSGTTSSSSASSDSTTANRTGVSGSTSGSTGSTAAGQSGSSGSSGTATSTGAGGVTGAGVPSSANTGAYGR